MPDLEPVEEYVAIEAWQMTSGDIGWRIKPLTGESINREILEGILFEMCEAMLDPAGDNNVLLSIQLQEKGSVLARWAPGKPFVKHEAYLWLKRKLYQAQWRVMGRSVEPRLLQIWWSIEWFYHHVSGHLDARQKASPAAPTRASASITPMLSEPFGGVETTSPPHTQPATVIPFGKLKND